MLPDKMLEALPHRQMAVTFRLPFSVEFIARKKADFARSTLDDPRVLHALYRNTTRGCDVVGRAVVPGLQPVCSNQVMANRVSASNSP